MRHSADPLMGVRSRLATAIVIVALAAAAGSSGAAERLIIAQVPADAAAERISVAKELWAYAPPAARSRIVLFDPSSPGKRIRNLTSGFESAGRPDVSFDGRRILFVGRRERGDLSQVWEMELDGGEVRRVSDVGFDILDAIYLSTIFTIDATEPVLQIAFVGISGDSPEGAIYTCRMDGTRVRRITFGPNRVSDPYHLSDGRLVFTRWTFATTASGSAGFVDTSLMTVHVDGTGLFPFAAVHEPPGVRTVSCETPAGRVIYAETLHGADRRWSLVSVARTRSLHTRRLVTDKIPGWHGSARVGPDDTLLVCSYPPAVELFGVRQLGLDPERGSSPVYDDVEWDEVEAVVLRPRPMPDGRSSVVDDRVDYGFLYGMNVYLSDRTESEHIAAGQIDRLRVFRALAGAAQTTSAIRKPEVRKPVAAESLAAKPIAEELLGEVSVEPDGSFYLRVPAGAPLRLQTVDADGRVLQSMRSYVWVMPMESRGCIGCHADRELTPPNRHVHALRKAPHEVGVVPDPSGKPLSRHAYDWEERK